MGDKKLKAVAVHGSGGVEKGSNGYLRAYRRLKFEIIKESRK